MNFRGGVFEGSFLKVNLGALMKITSIQILNKQSVNPCEKITKIRALFEDDSSYIIDMNPNYNVPTYFEFP